MKKVTILISLIAFLAISFLSCKKDDTPPKKTYTVEYIATCIGMPSAQFTIYYAQSGTAYSKTVIIPTGQYSSDWSTSFTASTGDIVLIRCSPPYSSIVTQSVYLEISYNGTPLGTTVQEWPSTAEVKGTLP